LFTGCEKWEIHSTKNGLLFYLQTKIIIPSFVKDPSDG